MQGLRSQPFFLSKQVIESWDPVLMNSAPQPLSGFGRSSCTHEPKLRDCYFSCRVVRPVNSGVPPGTGNGRGTTTREKQHWVLLSLKLIRPF